MKFQTTAALFVISFCIFSADARRSDWNRNRQNNGYGNNWADWGNAGWNQNQYQQPMRGYAGDYSRAYYDNNNGYNNGAGYRYNPNNNYNGAGGYRGTDGKYQDSGYGSYVNYLTDYLN